MRAGELCQADVPADCAPGDEVQLSVRPEKIWTEDPEEGMVSIEGTIAERVYVGTSTQVIVELSNGVRLIALDQNFNRAQADDRWEIGDRLRVSAGTRSTRWCCAEAARRPARGVARGCARARAAPASAEPLTVMTFNVWYGGVQVDFAADRRGDPPRRRRHRGRCRSRRATCAPSRARRACPTSTRACT